MAATTVGASTTITSTNGTKEEGPPPLQVVTSLLETHHENPPPPLLLETHDENQINILLLPHNNNNNNPIIKTSTTNNTLFVILVIACIVSMPIVIVCIAHAFKASGNDFLSPMDLKANTNFYVASVFGIAIYMICISIYNIMITFYSATTPVHHDHHVFGLLLPNISFWVLPVLRIPPRLLKVALVNVLYLIGFNAKWKTAAIHLPASFSLGAIAMIKLYGCGFDTTALIDHFVIALFLPCCNEFFRNNTFNAMILLTAMVFGMFFMMIPGVVKPVRGDRQAIEEEQQLLPGRWTFGSLARQCFPEVLQWNNIKSRVKKWIDPTNIKGWY